MGTGKGLSQDKRMVLAQKRKRRHLMHLSSANVTTGTNVIHVRTHSVLIAFNPEDLLDSFAVILKVGRCCGVRMIGLPLLL